MEVNFVHKHMDLFLVYDRNLYFGSGPIQPILKLANTFNQYQNHMLREKNLVTDSMRYFFHHKRAPETKFSSKH